jgi:hypothetical protein
MRSKIVYRIVEHDGSWAYKVGGVFSEAFPSHEEALIAAKRAAAEQEVSGATETIEYENDKGVWHLEVDPGDDRPAAEVVDEED